jgi:flagellar basal-body rod protein FlgB
MKLFSSTITLLEKGLDYSALKQKAISNNIANVDTPNYKAQNVSFRQIFEQERNYQSFSAYRTDKRHFDFQSRKTTTGAFITSQLMNYNHSGNSVDLDKEMADLATNQIYFHALTDRISGKFSSLQTVIKGGK